MLTFNELSAVNTARCNRWHGSFPLNKDGWTGADWSNAMQGEAGEAGNVVKKLRRLDIGSRQAEQGGLSDAQMRTALLGKLAKEIGDTAIYLDLLATFYGLDLGDCVRLAFNQVSEREGFPERLP